MKVKVLTISDRAFKDQYETGDVSGKAMIEVIKEYSEVFDQECAGHKALIVPDGKDQIQNAICNTFIKADEKAEIDLILTSGGTGYS